MNARSELDHRAILFKVVLVRLMEMTKFGSLTSDFNKLNTVPLSSLAMSSNDTEYTSFAIHPLLLQYKNTLRHTPDLNSNPTNHFEAHGLDDDWAR